MAKVFEKIVCRRLEEALGGMIHTSQHGFRSGHSTTTNLAEFIEKVLNGMSTVGQVDAIYTDFSKAFDRLDHKIVLRKLKEFGVAGNMLKWLGSYLHNRMSTVRLSTSPALISSEFLMASGVPQGSHLGPLLFEGIPP